MDYVKNGAWGPEEDQKLIDYIMKYGIWNWSHTPKFAGLSRSRKSCRLRWANYLRPDLKRGPFTMEEVETVIKMYQSLVNSYIVKELPGGTDNEIKNFYSTHLKKHLGTKVEVRPKARTKKAKKSKQMKMSNCRVEAQNKTNSPIYQIQKGSSSCITFDENYQITSPSQTSNDGMTSNVVNQNIVILDSNPDTYSSNLNDFMDSSNHVDFWLKLYMAADNMKI